MRLQCPKCHSSTGLGDVICFKCGSVSENRQFRTRDILENSEQLKLPQNITFNVKEFSLKAKQWLQIKCNLTTEQIRKYKIGYCSDINKIFIPAIKDDVVMFYQLRALDEGDIKYVTFGSSRGYVITYINNNLDYKKTLVITEDNISAIRVAKHCNVIALSGTTLQKSVIPSLLQSYNTFIFWLDADEPGQKATDKNAIALMHTIAFTNTRQMWVSGEVQQYEVFRVNAGKYSLDPKCYLDTEIKNILKETNNALR